MLSPSDQSAVDDFRALLKIPSISGGHDAASYAACAKLIGNLLTEMDVPYVTLEPVPGKPIIVATIRGTEPSLPCVLLNSHYDVVPVMREHWNCDPFAAEVHDKGYDASSPYVEARHISEGGPCVVGRGAQDMKRCACWSRSADLSGLCLACD